MEKKNITLTIVLVLAALVIFYGYQSLTGRATTGQYKEFIDSEIGPGYREDHNVYYVNKQGELVDGGFHDSALDACKDLYGYNEVEQTREVANVKMVQGLPEGYIEFIMKGSTEQTDVFKGYINKCYP